MDLFHYRKNELYCENVPVRRIAATTGTPTFVYSLGTALMHYQRLLEAFDGHEVQICYSVKANGNLALLAALARAGCGFDIVSAGELYRVRRAGGKARDVVFAGVGKTADEMEQAIRAGIGMFNIESWSEAKLLDRTASKLGRRVRAAFRLNPDVDAHTHAHVTTGRKDNKFGLPIEEAEDLFARARRSLRQIEIMGVHMHIGSQITEVAPYTKALARALAAIRRLRARGHEIRTLNLGGGLGIVYHRERPSTAKEFAAAILPLLRGQNLRLLIEPGRFVVGNAGILVTRVIYLKETPSRTFVIVDSGMNDLIRPSLYDAYHEVVPLALRASRGPRRRVDIVGPICESADFLAKDRLMPIPKPDQLVAVRSAGAFGFVMSSNYNGRPRAAEVLVDGGRFWTVRRRETHADLVRGETVPEAILRGRRRS
ncbi:MAG: diaminopimelate decarboxylase [Vicinamibacteria bacterium]|nr:diaminopimelate decarboxylase [Vicinamibacteria bacterium]